MNITISLISLGWIAVFIIQLFRPSPSQRLIIIFLLGIIFLFYNLTSSWSILFYLLWSTAVYLINQNPEKKYLVHSYIILVVGTFVAFRSGFIAYGSRNLLLEFSTPLGFSFIMFHSVALLLDRKNKVIPTAVGMPYFASTFFFTTIASGPFHKFQTFIENNESAIDGKKSFHGYCLFCLGVFKFALSGIILKFELLGNIPVIYNPIWSPHPLNVIFLCTLYLYANFSGYSDIVVGLSKMMGFEIPFNFKFPFLSLSMAEYWRKWHITLGSWFRDYVYYPTEYYLQKNNFLKLNAHVLTKVSLFFTFLLIGLWHQLSLKILVYAVANSLFVCFLFPKNKKWWGYIITFVAALLINSLFLSANLQSFFKLWISVGDLIPLEALQKNCVISAFFFISLSLFYLFEKIIDQLSQPSVSKGVFISNFTVSLITLFFAISWGAGHINAVYVGY